MIELMPAGLVHAELLAGIHKVCFQQPWAAGSMSEILAMPGCRALVAVDGGSLVPSAEPPGPAGMVIWSTILDEAEIMTLAVLPPWRRRGVGGALLDAAMDGARAGGACTMFLEAAADNAAALALYGSRGFERVGLRKKYYGDVDGIAMRCDLGASGGEPINSCG
jgi:ribosomal-protein-alanine N-acetyltransferase